MRLLPTLASLFAVSTLPLAAAAADGSICRGVDAPSVTVTVESTAPVRDLSRGSRELGAVPGRGVPPAGVGRGRVLGLSIADITESHNVEVRVTSLSDGSYCGVVSGVTIRFGFTGRRVLVARELPEGSCAFGEVAAHEARHVAVDDDAAREYRAVLEDRLTREARSAPAVRLRDPRSVVEAQRGRVGQAIRRALDDFNRIRDRRQAEVDTAEEYRRVSGSCGGEIGRYFPDGSGRM